MLRQVEDGSLGASHGFAALKGVDGAGTRRTCRTAGATPSTRFFSQFRAWVDANHNGMSEPAELPRRLAWAGGAQHQCAGMRRRDAFGNLLKVRALDLGAASADASSASS
jgi:hypothetical protein